MGLKVDTAIYTPWIFNTQTLNFYHNKQLKQKWNTKKEI